MVKATQKKLMKMLRSRIKFFIKRLNDVYSWDQWSNRSWSQEGEDLVLNSLFKGKDIGFYIDVGAHHPKRFSNTYFFYRRGWSGINIDATPGSMLPFHNLRPRDTNLEIGIALETSSLDFHIFNEPALNGFSSRLSMERHENNNSYILEKLIKVDVKPLSEVLKTNFSGDIIDFLTVDVEGLDLEVLKSNDWNRYRPRIVLAEILNITLSDLEKDDLVEFMTCKGYKIVAKTARTIFFIDTEEAQA